MVPLGRLRRRSQHPSLRAEDEYGGSTGYTLPANQSEEPKLRERTWRRIVLGAVGSVLLLTAVSGSSSLTSAAPARQQASAADRLHGSGVAYARNCSSPEIDCARPRLTEPPRAG